MNSLSLSYVAFLLLLAGCKREPLSNTAEYDRMHGIINDGSTVNRIQLFTPRGNPGPHLQFPVGQGVSPYTLNDNKGRLVIQKGRAHQLKLMLELTPPAAGVSRHLNVVFVFLSAVESSPNPVQFVGLERQRLAEAKFDVDFPEFGLRRYLEIHGQVPTGYIYTSLDSALKEPDGTPVFITCQAIGSPQRRYRPGHCSRSFRIARQLAVSYQFDPAVLSRWHGLGEQIHRLALNLLR